MMASMKKMVLLPRPRRVVGRQGEFGFSGEGRIACDGAPALLLPVAQIVQQDVWEHRRARWEIGAGSGEGDEGCRVLIRVAKGQRIPAQGYRLEVSPERVEILAGDAAGAFYGAMTLRQLLRQTEDALPAGQIKDHPDLPNRGVMLDVSRDKVPELETLFALVDLLAEWKINHLELYTEHTFAYRNHREVWAQASPLTGEDVLRLDAHCRERFVELVPNQNSFGHLHHWLELPRYIHLAECPDGFDYPWGGRHEGPFSLDPTNPQSLELIAELFAEMLPHFSSEKFNVGCDETFELGQGRSKPVCEEKGKGRVYLDFLLQIYELVEKHGRTMLFWGDIIIQHPELAGDLPRDVVVLEWGYDADHPFAERGGRFAESGIPFYVCPGTSSWNTIAGRTDNCLVNLREAASAGLEHGAAGFLNTDWGDSGHWQYLPVSYLGYAAGAALSWCQAAHREENFVAALDLHAFRDQAGVMGRLAYRLGNAYLRPGHKPGNASALFHILQRPADQELHEEVTAERLRETRAFIEEVAAPLRRARMERADADLVQDEYANAVRMLLHACERGIALREGTLGAEEERKRLAGDMRVILGEHRRLWTARNRVGGLQDSARRLEERLEEYRA